MKFKNLPLPAMVLVLSGWVMTGCQPASEEKEAETVTEVAVEVGKVVKTDLEAHLEAYGTVEPEPATPKNASATARITAAVAGVITQAWAVEGEPVKKGAVLFQLDDRVARAGVERAKQGVAKAQVAEKFAGQVLQREQTLIKAEGTSQKKLEEAQQQLASATLEVRAAEADLTAAQAQLKLLQVEAPLSGTLVKVNARSGESVDPASTLAEIADLGRLVVTASVPAGEVAELKTGQAVEVFTSSAEQGAIAGKVSFISPQVDAKTGTTIIRVALPKEAGLQPGQFARVRITTETRSGRLAVPSESVYTDHDGVSTLSIVEGDTAKQKVVKVGLRDGKLVEVQGEGVSEGTTVVTLGSYALPKETKIRVLSPSAK
jgi:RND family efflux transporter MFP subunit